MKKILLGTTLLSASFFAAAAQADSPKVTVGGFADFQAGWISEDLDTDLRGHAFRNDTEISFKVDGKTDGGLGYGAEIWLEADVTDDADTQGTNASKTMLYLEGNNWGRFEMGSMVGVQGTMKLDASNIARATGGIDGDFNYYFTAPTAGTLGQFIATPDLVMGHGGVDETGAAAAPLGTEALENASKISYYTPRWSGFQFGASYTPAQTDSGQTIARGDATTGAGVEQADGIWSLAAAYNGKWDQVGIALAATYEHGNAEDNTLEDLQAWNVGGKVSWGGFAVAGSYGDWGDSLRTKTTTGVDDSHYWTLGGSYETGPYGFSVTYFDSEFDVSSTVENEFQNLSVGADFKMAPGLTPYIDVSFIEADQGGTDSDNDGTVVIVGSVLNF